MSDAFVGEIRMFGGNYPPKAWAYCDGQSLPVSGNETLYSLLGTTYGGDGITNFNLPDLRGRLPMHYGSGPGLLPRTQGQHFGIESVQLEVSHLPSHSHQMFCSPEASNNVAEPEGHGVAAGKRIYADVTTTSAATLDAGSVGMTGLGTKHSNMMPTLAVHFIIALSGDYPPRT